MKITVHEKKLNESVSTGIIDADKSKFNFDLVKDNVQKLSSFLNKIYGNDIPLILGRGSSGSSGFEYQVSMSEPVDVEIRFDTTGLCSGFIYSSDGNERWKINSSEDMDDSLAEEIKAYNESH